MQTKNFLAYDGCANNSVDRETGFGKTRFLDTGLISWLSSSRANLRILLILTYHFIKLISSMLVVLDR